MRSPLISAQGKIAKVDGALAVWINLLVFVSVMHPGMKIQVRFIKFCKQVKG